MKLIRTNKQSNVFFSLMVLAVVSVLAGTGNVVLNTIYALVATKNDFNLISRIFINILQLLISSALIYFLINSILIKIQFFSIKEKVHFFKILENKWAAIILILPIITNNKFTLIDRSIIYVFVFAFFVALYLFFQTRNYLSMITHDSRKAILKSNISFILTLIITDIVLVEFIQRGWKIWLS